MPKNFEREIAGFLQVISSTEDRTVKEFIALVDKLRERIILQILQFGELSPYLVSQIKQSVASILNQYESLFFEVMNENQRRVFIKGIQVIDSTVESGGKRVALPYVSEQLLERTKAYSADLVRGLNNSARDSISKTIDLAVLGQKSTMSVINEIGKNLTTPSIFGTIGRRAEIIAKTEINRVYRLAQWERIQQLVRQYPNMKKQWIHAHMGFPRRGHLLLDGKILPAMSKFTLHSEKGQIYHINAPYDPELPAGEVVNCRCTIKILLQ